jgi:REase_DpnII-MboI
MGTVGASEKIERLTGTSHELDRRAAQVQGERELEVSAEEIARLSDDYHRWYAEALALLPEAHQAEFKDRYHGGIMESRIKSFLTSPGKTNPLFNPDGGGLVDYWRHPYGVNFHGSIVEQRHLLELARASVATVEEEADVALVERIGRGLPRVVSSLAERGRGRAPFEVTDEYDVQDLLGAILRDLFEDVRAEDPASIRAGASTRVDFVLKSEEILVEAKMTRAGLTEKKLADQLIEDIERYRSHPDFRTLVAIVYDPERRIGNPRGLESDLRRDSEELRVRVVISS